VPISTPILTVNALDGLIDRIQVAALRSLTLAAGLLLSLAAVWWSVEVQLIERRWLAVTLCSVAALFIGGAGVWVRRQMERERKREIRCSFCGQTSSESGAEMKQASRFTSTAICVRCADEFARQLHLSEEAEAKGPAKGTATGATARTTAMPASARFDVNVNSVNPQRQPTGGDSAGSSDRGEPEPVMRALPAQVTAATATRGGAANGKTGSARSSTDRPASQPPGDGEATYE
jgi:hypothetical protein